MSDKQITPYAPTGIAEFLEALGIDTSPWKNDPDPGNMLTHVIREYGGVLAAAVGTTKDPIPVPEDQARLGLPYSGDRMGNFFWGTHEMPNGERMNHMVFQIRGWGHYTGQGWAGLGLSNAEAWQRQKEVQEFVVTACNEYHDLVEWSEKLAVALETMVGSSDAFGYERLSHSGLIRISAEQKRVLDAYHAAKAKKEIASPKSEDASLNPGSDEKAPMNLRLTGKARKFMQEMAKQKGISQTAVVELAVRLYADREELEYSGESSGKEIDEQHS